MAGNLKKLNREYTKVFEKNARNIEVTNSQIARINIIDLKIKPLI
jgi:hypothetical protein